MSIFLFVAGLSLLYDFPIIAYLAIVIHVFVYNTTQGSVTWLYVPEVTTDESSGLIMGF